MFYPKIATIFSQRPIESALGVDLTDETVGAVLMSMASLKATILNILVLKLPRGGLNGKPIVKQADRPSKGRSENHWISRVRLPILLVVS